MRNSIRLFALFALFTFLLGGATGCNGEKVGEVINNNKDNIVKGIGLVSEQATRLGLKKLAKDNPETAKEVATALNMNIQNELIPYLNGDKLAASAEIQGIINSSLFKNVPEEVKFAIIAAASVLDIYLPIPSSDIYLKEDHVDYLKAFLMGISKAAGKFAESPENAFSSGYENKWIK